MKNVYVVCATGIATSTMVRLKVEKFLQANGVEANVTQYRVTELSPARVRADAIVATTQMPPEYHEVAPVINGMSLLTGVGEQESLQALLDVLKNDKED